jgi:diaminopimelate epimerase
MKKVSFTKMEGLGNDYVYIDSTEEDIRLTSKEIAHISNRNFGVGSDGVIFIRKSPLADFKMDMYNSDGSYSEMCGNGIRCVGKYIYDKGLTTKLNPIIETGKGLLELSLFLEQGRVNMVRVNMGNPILKPAQIPVNVPEADSFTHTIQADGYTLDFIPVSMGNPHAVIFVDNADAFPVETIGPIIENHPLFPKRVNVEFVSKIGENHFFQRTWERGAGETLACGTGACAVAVAANLQGEAGKQVQIDLKGGTLNIEWSSTGDIFMTGPAKFTFEGELYLD